MRLAQLLVLIDRFTPSYFPSLDNRCFVLFCCFAFDKFSARVFQSSETSFLLRFVIFIPKQWSMKTVVASNVFFSSFSSFFLSSLFLSLSPSLGSYFIIYLFEELTEREEEYRKSSILWFTPRWLQCRRLNHPEVRSFV